MWSPWSTFAATAVACFRHQDFGHIFVTKLKNYDILEAAMKKNPLLILQLDGSLLEFLIACLSEHCDFGGGCGCLQPGGTRPDPMAEVYYV